MVAPPGPEVQQMFSDIAPRYDFLNRLLSFGIDRRWRKRAVRELQLRKGDLLLDLCCGTGDLAIEFAQTGVHVVGADFTGPMLPLAQTKGEGHSVKLSWVQADAQCLPFQSDSFKAATIAFGIRNVFKPQKGLLECARVIQPGGTLAVLEFFPIQSRLWGALFGFYFHHVLPLLAKVVRAGRTGAYEYLPESVAGFATPTEFTEWMTQAGFTDIQNIPLTGGVARLMLGRLPQEEV